MVSLKIQKRLAASVMKCGKGKVWLDPNESQDISMANSRMFLSFSFLSSLVFNLESTNVKLLVVDVAWLGGYNSGLCIMLINSSDNLREWLVWFWKCLGQNIRKLVKDGFIIRKPTKIHSRSRARRMKIAKMKGRHSGYGMHPFLFLFELKYSICKMMMTFCLLVEKVRGRVPVKLGCLPRYCGCVGCVC